MYFYCQHAFFLLYFSLFIAELEKPVDTNNFGPDMKARKLYSKCISHTEVKDNGLSEGRLN